jgi:hypothetical protein
MCSEITFLLMVKKGKGKAAKSGAQTVYSLLFPSNRHQTDFYFQKINKDILTNIQLNNHGQSAHGRPISEKSWDYKEK